MEYLAIVTNILLAFLTGLYVILTYRLVNETKRSTDQSSLPTLNLNLSSNENILNLTVYNSGNVSAFDVDIIINGIYYNDEIKINSFKKKYMQTKYKNELKSVSEEGTYGVYDRIVYPIFPPKRKVISKLNYLVLPSCFYCLLQFRQLSGKNYSQVYFISENENNGNRTYHIWSIDPPVLITTPRIEFDFRDSKKLVADKRKKIPEFAKEFQMQWKYSVSSGFTKCEDYSVEDRGTWFDI